MPQDDGADFPPLVTAKAGQSADGAQIPSIARSHRKR
jgi:hypothetical protein